MGDDHQISWGRQRCSKGGIGCKYDDLHELAQRQARCLCHCRRQRQRYESRRHVADNLTEHCSTHVDADDAAKRAQGSSHHEDDVRDALCQARVLYRGPEAEGCGNREQQVPIDEPEHFLDCQRLHEDEADREDRSRERQVKAARCGCHEGQDAHHAVALTPQIHLGEGTRRHRIWHLVDKEEVGASRYWPRHEALQKDHVLRLDSEPVAAKRLDEQLPPTGPRHSDRHGTESPAELPGPQHLPHEGRVRRHEGLVVPAVAAPRAEAADLVPLGWKEAQRLAEAHDRLGAGVEDELVPLAEQPVGVGRGAVRGQGRPGHGQEAQLSQAVASNSVERPRRRDDAAHAILHPQRRVLLPGERAGWSTVAPCGGQCAGCHQNEVRHAREGEEEPQGRQLKEAHWGNVMLSCPSGSDEIGAASNQRHDAAKRGCKCQWHHELCLGHTHLDDPALYHGDHHGNHRCVVHECRSDGDRNHKPYLRKQPGFRVAQQRQHHVLQSA
mmetsp:Transcript_22640/g.64368  ORF Transcript_22640/g.64368 Transcript_22640/m.64368 type:complete len:498 (-) Transcript_22640:272-1765(-)